VPGSPERCLHRLVVEDSHGAPWLLERLGPRQAARREAIGLLPRSPRDKARIQAGAIIFDNLRDVS